MKKTLFICLLLVSALCLLTATPAMAKKVYPEVKGSKGLAPYLYLPDNPTPAVIKINEAKQAWFEDRYEEACELWKESLNLNPHHPAGIWHDMGDCYLKTREYDKSVDAFTHALEIYYPQENATVASAYKGRAKAYWKMGDMENMQKDLDTANAMLGVPVAHPTPTPQAQNIPPQAQNIPAPAPQTPTPAVQTPKKSADFQPIATAFGEIKEYLTGGRSGGFSLLLITIVVVLGLLCASKFAFPNTEEYILKLVQKGDLEGVKKELKRSGYNINQRRGQAGVTLLMEAVYHEQIEVIKYLLLCAANTEIQDNQTKETVLFHAAVQDSPVILRLLLDKGANTNARDAQGKTPLMHAIIAEQKENARVLIERGADVNLWDNKGSTAYEYALVTHQKAIQQMLLGHGAERNSRRPR